MAPHTETLRVTGMSCGGCVKSITGILAALPGVARAEVSLEQGRAVVEFEAEQVDRAELVEAIESAGFDAA